jgi:hypothetical protein
MYLQWTKIDVGKPHYREANRIQEEKNILENKVVEKVKEFGGFAERRSK